MPNLVPPVKTVKDVKAYKERILKAIKNTSPFLKGST
jgi:dihydroorotase